MTAAEHPTYAGGCLCDAVRFEARGPALNVRACHCRLCRKAAGALMFVRAIFPASAVTRTGETRRHRSSERLWRLFCPECGTLLFGEPVDRPEMIAVSLASFDDPDALAPEVHIWTSAKPRWLALDDGLPQHAEGFPG